MVLRLSDVVLGELCEGSNPLFSSLASRFSGVAIQISKVDSSSNAFSVIARHCASSGVAIHKFCASRIIITRIHLQGLWIATTSLRKSRE